MPYMDKELEMAHVIEERRLSFEEFVQQQKAKGSPGMTDAALHSIGHRDSYGPIVFEKGIMHQSLWVMEPGKNPRVLIYMKRDEAENYAKSLLPILKNIGYGFSKIWVEKIAVRQLIPNGLSALMSPSVLYDDGDRFVIRLKVL